MNRLQTGKNKFIINQCFSLLKRSWLRAVIYFILASELMSALMYLNVIIWNMRVQNDSLRSFSGGMFVNYPDPVGYVESTWYDIVDGKIQLMKNFVERDINEFYRSTGVAFFEEDRGLYAFAPWKVVQNDKFTLYATDEDSLKVFDWPLRRGRYFGEDLYEVLAFQGSADVGDKVTIEKDGNSYEFCVVGVLDIRWLPARYQSDKYRYINNNLEVYGLAEIKLNQGYLLHPKSHLASREYALSGSGVYIKQEGLVSGRGKERLKIIQHGSYLYIRDWNWSRGGIYQWLRSGVETIIFSLLALLLWTWLESKRRYQKFREEFRVWNICGMSKKSVEWLFGRVMILPVVMGMMKSLVGYLWNYRRLPNHFWNLLILFSFAGGYMLLRHFVLKKNFDCYVLLEKNEKNAFLGNRVAVNFPLLMQRTVYENIRIPLELAGRSETEVIEDVERCLAIAFILSISQEKCCKLTPYEQFRVKVARALCFTPEVLYVGREWEALQERDKKEMARYFENITNTLGVRIEFNQW